MRTRDGLYKIKPIDAVARTDATSKTTERNDPLLQELINGSSTEMNVAASAVQYPSASAVQLINYPFTNSVGGLLREFHASQLVERMCFHTNY